MYILTCIYLSISISTYIGVYIYIYTYTYTGPHNLGMCIHRLSHFIAAGPRSHTPPATHPATLSPANCQIHPPFTPTPIQPPHSRQRRSSLTIHADADPASRRVPPGLTHAPRISRRLH